MSTVLVSPSREQIAEVFDSVETQANFRARERTAYFPGSLPDRILDTPEGRWEDNGGGVANCYGYRAYSTIVGAAWWTDADGVKHVRIHAGRTSCSGRHVSSIFGHVGTRAQHAKIPAWAFVYPPVGGWKRFRDEWLAGAETGPFARAIADRPQDSLNWLIFADWLDEHGQTYPAADIRRTFRTPAAC